MFEFLIFPYRHIMGHVTTTEYIMKTSDQSNLMKGHISAAHGYFNGIRQVTSI